VGFSGDFQSSLLVVSGMLKEEEKNRILHEENLGKCFGDI
jgi:hypothetical protein